jgi:hypothetical protein
MTPERVYHEDGVWTVRAVATFDDNSKAVAKQSLHVEKTEGTYIAFATSSSSVV